MPEAVACVTRTIPAQPAEVWEALTTPETIKTYFFGADVESDWRVGAAIRFRGEIRGKPYEDKGEIRSFEPEKRLSFSHYSPLSGAPDKPENYHLVTFELEPQGEATKVTLTQANLTGGVRPSDLENRAEFEKNWASVLDGLKEAVAH